MPPSQRRQKTINSWIDTSIAAHAGDFSSAANDPSESSPSHAPRGQSRAGTAQIAQWLLRQRLQPTSSLGDEGERGDKANAKSNHPHGREVTAAPAAASQDAATTSLGILARSQEEDATRKMTCRGRGDVYSAADDPWTAVPLYHSRLTLESVHEMFRESLEANGSGGVVDGDEDFLRNEKQDWFANASVQRRHDKCSSSIDPATASTAGRFFDEGCSPNAALVVNGAKTAAASVGGGGGISNSFPAEKLMLHLAARGAVSSQALLEYMSFRPGTVVVVDAAAPAQIRNAKPAPAVGERASAQRTTPPSPHPRTVLAQRSQQQQQQPPQHLPSKLLSLQKRAAAARSTPATELSSHGVLGSSRYTPQQCVPNGQLPLNLLAASSATTTTTTTGSSPVYGMPEREASQQGAPLASSWGPVMGCRWRWDRATCFPSRRGDDDAHPLSVSVTSDASFGWQEILP